MNCCPAGRPPHHHLTSLLFCTKRLRSFKSPVFQSARLASLITMAGADAPGECRLVNELNVYKEDALLEFVFHPPNPRLSREHRDIVRRAREAWVSAFFFSQLDVGSFSGPQLSALCDQELR